MQKVYNLFGHYSIMVKQRYFYETRDSGRSSVQAENDWGRIFNIKGIVLKDHAES